MHAILSTLVAATLLAHALLGCCWHHAHGCVICESEKPDAASPEAAPTAICCRHDAQQDKRDLDQHAGHEQPRHGPCPCQIDCCGGCAYLPTPRALSVDRESAPGDCLATFLPALATGQSVQALSWRLGSSPAQTEPPLRLHLLHHILLI